MGVPVHSDGVSHHRSRDYDNRVAAVEEITVTRTDFQLLADTFLDEAQILFSQGKPGGAYYMAGYAVECALKACIAKRTAEHDFPPDRKFVADCYTHDLGTLVKSAGLRLELDRAVTGDPDLSSRWSVVQAWDESSRYDRKTGTKAQDLIEAITDPQHGVLPWIKTHW
jgi:hypothetical protein